MSGFKCKGPRATHLAKHVAYRMGQPGSSLLDLIQMVPDLERRGVDVESLLEKVETSSAAGSVVLQVFAALSDFKRWLIRKRAQAELAAARVRGRAGRRRPNLDVHQVRENKVLLLNPSIEVADVAPRYGVSRTTMHKYVGVVAPKLWGHNMPTTVTCTIRVEE